jgi:hypothetical protein
VLELAIAIYKSGIGKRIYLLLRHESETMLECYAPDAI